LHGAKRGKFSVTAARLHGGKQYDIIVAGIKVGILQTNSAGSGHTRFSTKPRGKDSLLGFDPPGPMVTVRDEDSGDDDLVGDMSDDNPGEVACCIADHEDSAEVECEELTPDECTAEGGHVQTATSCLPDPCSTTPPSEEIVCCTNATHDDES